MVYDVDRSKWAEGSAANRLAHLMYMVTVTDDPEVVAEFEIAAQECGAELAEHIEDLLQYRANLIAAASSAETESERLANLAQERRTRANRLQEAVAQYLVTIGQTEMITDRHTLRVKKNPPKVEIFEQAAIPAEYMVEVVKTETRPDKKAIAEALKMGMGVNGCALIQTNRLEIK